MEAESSPQPGQLVAGKYRMVRELGRGAMGAVYQAEQLATGKRVAIKWLHPHVLESRSAVERLIREAQASARVRHMNVVDVYDVERDGDTMFLVMEYLEGETLANLLERGGAPTHEVIAMIVQAMRGVAEAHRQGIVHRDIKPDNIFLAHQNDQAQPIAKVLDFGISKLDAPGGLSLTQTGSALGTPLYMSYEQLSGSRDVDQRSDVYAFGVILYEALTGHLPYSAENFAELAAKVITSEPTRPRELRPELPERLEQIVMWAMRKRRDERPASLSLLIDALLPFTVPQQDRASFHGRGSSLLPPRHSMAAPSSSPPVAPVPSTPAPPALRLDTSEWDSVVDRNQRSKREMEDRVTALIAGTMQDHDFQPRRAPKRGLWMGVGAAVTLAGGAALLTLLVGNKPAPQPAPTAEAPKQETPAPVAPVQEPEKPAASEPKVEQPAAQAETPELPKAAPTAVEPAQMEPAHMEAVQPTVPVLNSVPAGTVTPNARGASGASNSLNAADSKHPQHHGRSPVPAAAWRPSAEPFVPPALATEPPVAATPEPAPVVAAPVQEAPAPAPESKPESKPGDLEVPGTAPNPFVEGDEKDDNTKYRAGKPREDEF